MTRSVVTPSPGFISIAVDDVERSAAFYEQYLGAVRDTFDWGPQSAVYVGWPTLALSGARRPGEPGPSPETTSIQVWWRASDAQALYESARDAGVPIVREPFDGPFGRTFTFTDPDGYAVTVHGRA
jgi:predicted enzyme related to lactoylglutathione lyase